MNIRSSARNAGWDKARSLYYVSQTKRGIVIAVRQRLRSGVGLTVCAAGSGRERLRATARTRSVSRAAAKARLSLLVPTVLCARLPAGSETADFGVHSMGFATAGVAFIPSRL